MSARVRDRGFTLIELLLALAILSIVVRLALPRLQEALIRDRATSALADVEVVRAAVASYHTRTSEWPADAPAGHVPAELAADLPDGFSFERVGYRLDWERWSLPSGLPGSPAPRTVLGISVATEDTLLGNAVAAQVGPTGWYRLGNTSTFLMDGS